MVVVLPLNEIQWFRRAREALSNPSSSSEGDTVKSWSYLDLKLNGEDLDALGDALRTERLRQAPQIGISRTKHHHYPVRLVDDAVLRIEWNGVRPRLKKTLRILGRKLRVEPEWKIGNANWEELEGHDLEDRILDLLDRGDEIGATTLIRRKYGYSTTEAKKFADELMGRSGNS